MRRPRYPPSGQAPVSAQPDDHGIRRPRRREEWSGEMRGPMTDMAGLSAGDVMEVLDSGARVSLSPGSAVSQLDHALQTARALERLHPDDLELAIAGLVHDIGHLLPGGRDETHADDAASAVRASLGERVSGIVGLHVEAKRYLVAVEGRYGGALSADSVTSLARQGGAMGSDELAAFLDRPFAADAVVLRRCDDLGKDEHAAGGFGPGERERWDERLRGRGR
jgi:predicted HD phosphohydrolase